MACQKFDSALLKAVDYAFNSLGKSSRQALYFHLKNTFNIKKTEIPTKIMEFDKALKFIFKDGSIFLEKLILERLCKELRIKLDEDCSFDFAETIQIIRDMILENESKLTASTFDEISLTE